MDGLTWLVYQAVDLNARVLPVLYGKTYEGPYEEKKVCVEHRLSVNA
jgi:hypothetical protein